MMTPQVEETVMSEPKKNQYGQTFPPASYLRKHNEKVRQQLFEHDAQRFIDQNL